MIFQTYFFKIRVQFNQSISIRYLGYYQTNEISINKIHLCNGEETQKVRLKWNRYIYTLLMQL